MSANDLSKDRPIGHSIDGKIVKKNQRRSAGLKRSFGGQGEADIRRAAGAEQDGHDLVLPRLRDGGPAAAAPPQEHHRQRLGRHLVRPTHPICPGLVLLSSPLSAGCLLSCPTASAQQYRFSS